MADNPNAEDLLERQLARERIARKQAEKLLEEKSRELYQSNLQLREQTAKLEALNKELERSNEELEKFAYVASHDLQAPLRNITGFVQLLEQECKDQLSKDAVEFLGIIEQAAKHMQALIQDLLQLSRITTQAEPLQPVSMQAVADQACAMLRMNLEEAGAQIRYGNLPEVLGDRGQLIQLLQNLLGNAIKFQAPGVQPEVDITAQAEDDMWHFVVQDNGIGISQDHLQAIFGIFRRLHAAEKYPGTGIGLSICKKIVERHGGRIWVESEANRGSAFRFLLQNPQALEQKKPTSL